MGDFNAQTDKPLQGLECTISLMGRLTKQTTEVNDSHFSVALMISAITITQKRNLLYFHQ